MTNNHASLPCNFGIYRSRHSARSALTTWTYDTTFAMASTKNANGKRPAEAQEETTCKKFKSVLLGSGNLVLVP